MVKTSSGTPSIGLTLHPFTIAFDKKPRAHFSNLRLAVVTARERCSKSLERKEQSENGEAFEEAPTKTLIDRWTVKDEDGIFPLAAYTIHLHKNGHVADVTRHG